MSEYTVDQKLRSEDLHGLPCRVPEPTPEQAKCSHTETVEEDTGYEDDEGDWKELHDMALELEAENERLKAKLELVHKFLRYTAGIAHDLEYAAPDQSRSMVNNIVATRKALEASDEQN